MKTKFGWSIYAAVIMSLILFMYGGEAADNFVNGFQFDGATGLHTGADLEDLISQAHLASSAFNGDNTNRLFNLNIFTSTLSGTTYLLSLAPDGVNSNYIANNTIGSTQLTVSSVGSYEIIDYSVSAIDINTNAIEAYQIGTNSIGPTKIQYNGGVTTQHFDWTTTRQIALFEHREAYNVEGGTSTAATWHVRKLNTEVYDTGNFASLADFEVTIASAGVYRVSAGSVSYYSEDNFIAVKDDSENILICGSREINANASASSQPAHLAGILTVDSPPLAIKLMHYLEQNRNDDGMGKITITTNATWTNVFGWIEFEKVR